MSIFRLLAYASLGVISIGVILFFSDSRESILGQIELEKEEDTVAYAVARNASTTYYDERGEISYLFNSDKLSHFRPAGDPTLAYTSVEKPYVIFYEGKSPWEVKAALGKIDIDRNIELFDDVTIQYTDEFAKQTELKTQKLHIDTLSKLAKTEEPVTIRSPLGELTAVGMQADIKARKIKLLSKVSGHHRPEILR
jgi:lipopolysaccharide export system protein LptC